MDAAERTNVQMTPDSRIKLMDRNKLWMKAHADYQMPYTESWHEVYDMIANHPHKTSFLGWLAELSLSLLMIGCLRASKNVYREFKNR